MYMMSLDGQFQNKPNGRDFIFEMFYFEKKDQTSRKTAFSKKLFTSI